MNISEKSVHYKILRWNLRRANIIEGQEYSRLDDLVAFDRPKDLCTFIRRCYGSILFRLCVIGSIWATISLVYVVTMARLDEIGVSDQFWWTLFENTGIAIAFIAGAAGIIIFLAGMDRAKTAIKRASQKSLAVNYLKAVKEKVCPLIEYSKRSKK